MKNNRPPAVQVRPPQKHPRAYVFQGEACQSAQGLQLSGMQMRQLPARTTRFTAASNVESGCCDPGAPAALHTSKPGAVRNVSEV